jgi:L-threonylcarbamoyladenylate synthase
MLARHLIVRPTRLALKQAARLLRAGRLVAFPTETVYGLGGDATSDRAIAGIYAAKRRPRHNPLIVHVATTAEARRLAHFDSRAERLARSFWPGPLTLVLTRRAGARLSRYVSPGLNSVAIRIPADPVALALIRQSARPVAAPSANRSGGVSPTRAHHVRQSLGGRVAMILDGGPCAVGLESTVVDLTGRTPRLLRPGGIALEALQAAIGKIATDEVDVEELHPASPGRLLSHYAPDRPVRMNAERPRTGEAYLGFGANNGGSSVTLNLSEKADLAEAAANLFAMLRTLDRPEFTAIAVAPIPHHGLGRAINDRLRRAAAPRRA